MEDVLTGGKSRRIQPEKVRLTARFGFQWTLKLVSFQLFQARKPIPVCPHGSTSCCCGDTALLSLWVSSGPCQAQIRAGLGQCHTPTLPWGVPFASTLSGFPTQRLWQSCLGGHREEQRAVLGAWEVPGKPKVPQYWQHHPGEVQLKAE